jgi:hypothetical protein
MFSRGLSSDFTDLIRRWPETRVYLAECGCEVSIALAPASTRQPGVDAASTDQHELALRGGPDRAAI